MNDELEYCPSHALASYLGGSFTVYCYLVSGHAGDHESPDYRWKQGESVAVPK